LEKGEPSNQAKRVGELSGDDDLMNTVNRELTLLGQRLLPRLLTQVCRDPNSPAYGSFDRNWWHYKIRDFSSVILQQGGYALAVASALPEFVRDQRALTALAAGACRFWNTRAEKLRAFEEYYPWEEGYPPLAFSTLAVSKLVAEGVVPLGDVLPGLTKAARQLQGRFEAQATNQQVAGTAALSGIRKVAPELVDESVFRDLCSRTLSCQQEEGWFMEYGGPDLGYLAVTMDCLWDIFDTTGDERFRESARRALHFIARFSSLPRSGAGLHNARNTDYIVPYGIARFLGDLRERGTAAHVLQAFFADASSPEHFLAAVDDRYYCHYIGHSLFRALPLIRAWEAAGGAKTGGPSESYLLKGCGYYFHRGVGGTCDALVSGRKGGIATFWLQGHEVSDFGWVVRTEKADWVSHWWSDDWRLEPLGQGLRVEGRLTPHIENESTPFRHMVLRGVSLLFGRRIIGLLKEKMIFKEKRSVDYRFSRDVEWLDNGVRITDVIHVPPLGRVTRAPRSSKRHVASADSFHPQDLQMVSPEVVMHELRAQQGNQLTVITTYGVARK
jgi:hypothetical protein